MKKNILKSIIGFLVTAGIVLIALELQKPLVCLSPYPYGKNFAFTITDDPDGASLEKIRPIYELLDNLGLKTTMACWAYKPKDLTGMPDPSGQVKSDTLERAEYLAFLNEYQRKGFEMALHTATSGNDVRQDTIKGYERFKEAFGHYPVINIMHSKNMENIYWGVNVFRNPLMRFLVSLYDKTPFSGEDIGSPYFWGDICKEKTKYVRLWGTSDINTLRFNPSMPYHDPDKPYVNYWFSFSDGYTARYFNSMLSVKNIEKLIKQRGTCIVYTHFAAGFTYKEANGEYKVNESTKNALVELASHKDGWFVPASKIMDRLLLTKGVLVKKSGKKLIIINTNKEKVYEMAVILGHNAKYQDQDGNNKVAEDGGEVYLGDLGIGDSIVLTFFSDFRVFNALSKPGFFENVRLVFERSRILLFSHRG